MYGKPRLEYVGKLHYFKYTVYASSSKSLKYSIFDLDKEQDVNHSNTSLDSHMGTGPLEWMVV